MPVAKLCTSGTLNAMSSEEGNDSLDTFIRQPTGKESFLPFTRLGESPVQWIQLLLDQPDLPGWPLLTPVKVQMQKCEKCSREFCSPINYRRHIRVHRRSLNVNKESHQKRDILASFWDKLSLEEAKEVMSFDDVRLKEVPGSSVIRDLASSLHKQAFWSLPQFYVNAGSTLLDIVQAKPSRLPVSSRELFSVLDEASERTFLSAGTAESVQKYVFDGETATNSLELKNLVASTCFLFEHQLVKAWLADKDAEALRCQKLLVEEEEAAKKRQAALVERKKQKKLRQKEHKVKVLGQTDLNLTVVALEDPASAEASDLSSSSDSNFNSLDMPTNLDSFLEPMQFESKESDTIDIEAQLDFSDKTTNEDNNQTSAPEMVGANGHQQFINYRWKVPRFQRGGRFHVGQNLQNLEPEYVHKPGPSKDRALLNGSRVWTKKFNAHSDAESLKPQAVQGQTNHQTEENKCELIIGSIPITLKTCVGQLQDNRPDDTMVKNNASEKLIRGDIVKSGTNRAASKLWRPVSCGETKSNPLVDRGNDDSERVVVLVKVNGGIMPSEIFTPSQSADGDSGFSDGNAREKYLPFCSIKAKEFLAQRWKEAISGDHVKLVISSRPESLGCSDGILDNAEKQVGRSAQVKFRKKPEKSLKIQYIPKQKAAA